MPHITPGKTHVNHFASRELVCERAALCGRRLAMHNHPFVSAQTDMRWNLTVLATPQQRSVVAGPRRLAERPAFTKPGVLRRQRRCPQRTSQCPKEIQPHVRTTASLRCQSRVDGSSTRSQRIVRSWRNSCDRVTNSSCGSIITPETLAHASRCS